MKLFVDNNLSPHLARGLNALFAGRHQIEHVRDKFGTGAVADEEWIKVLGGEGGWCVLSGDRRIAKNRVQRHLFNLSVMTGFFPAPAVLDLNLEKQAARILNMWGYMVAGSQLIEGGCYEIGIKGDRLRSM